MSNLRRRRTASNFLSPGPRFAVALLTAVLALSGVAPQLAAAQDLMAVTGHFLHNDRFNRKDPYWRIDRTLPLVKELGVRTVHEQIYAWGPGQTAVIPAGRNDPEHLRTVEENCKQIDQWLSVYDNSGVKVVLAVLAYHPAANISELRNSEYFAWLLDLIPRHPSIIAVQMHNEPNLTHFWKGTPEEYVDIYRPFAKALKARRPDVKIIMGAISSLWWRPGVDWLRRAVDHGMLDLADGISVHPYNVDSPPEVDPHWRGGSASDPDHREKALLAFWQQIRNWNTSGKPLDLFFTEFGWNTATKGRAHVDEVTQADYLARSFLIFQGVRLRGVPLRSAHWYDFKDDGLRDDNGEHRYGLINFDLTRRKPSFFALKALNAFFGRSDNFELSKRKPEIQSQKTPFTVKAAFWRRKTDGAEIVAFWSTGTASATPGKATLRIPGIKVETAKLFSAAETGPRTIPADQQGSDAVIDIEPTSRPQWIEIKGN